MKNNYLIIFLLFSSTIYSQSIIYEIRDSYKGFDCKLFSLNLSEQICYRLDTMLHNNEFTKELSVEINTETPVGVLNVNVVNNEKYSCNANFYNYLEIDSLNRFSLIYLNKSNQIIGIAEYYNSEPVYYPLDGMLLPDYTRHLRAAYKNISKYRPEFILNCEELFKTMLFLKDDKIYVYRIFNKDVFELNDYIRKFYKESEIRQIRKGLELFM